MHDSTTTRRHTYPPGTFGGPPTPESTAHAADLCHRLARVLARVDWKRLDAGAKHGENVAKHVGRDELWRLYHTRLRDIPALFPLPPQPMQAPPPSRRPTARPRQRSHTGTSASRGDPPDAESDQTRPEARRSVVTLRSVRDRLTVALEYAAPGDHVAGWQVVGDLRDDVESEIRRRHREGAAR